ncbi:MAG TPA: succinate--CoA ligase subunit alpha [Armatimonadota bacterium]|nr:succinate--CoA ligase subunit alpha [Armatimonadota bacterium]HOM71077.1 succinate--CoA ligase subunit alpha [Armatimonadota bacterium]
MSILIDQNTKVLVQGLTGREGQFHAQQMIDYGTKVVAGVTPGKGGTEALGVPVFDTVKDAVSATGANAACIFVPARFAMDAIMEDIDAGLDVVVAITDGIPTQDMIKVVNALRKTKTTLIGPNCPGLTSAGKCKIGIMPGNIFKQGPVGVISRSGTLTYEIVDELTRAGLGQTTCIGIGGDPVLGMRFIDALPLFEADPETEAVVLVGEIGGSDEEIASEYIKQMTKPVVGFISGRSAPPGKRMGHAGAIISGRTGTPEAKLEALTAAGVPVADTTQEIPTLVAKALQYRQR